MNGIKYLLDTCFIIQWHAQTDEAFTIIERLNLHPSECAYSDISHVEVFGYQGITAKAEQELRFLLTDIMRLSINHSVIDATIQIRKRHPIKLPDCMILSTALTHGLKLLTFDEKLATRYQQLTMDYQSSYLP